MKTRLLFILILFLAFQPEIFSQTYQTHCRNNLNINITDNSIIKDSIQINVPNFYYIRDINIRIDTLIHTWVSDLSIYIRKGTTGVKLFDNTGGSGDNFIGTIFDDSAATSINTATAPFTGSFSPANPLSIFNNSFNYNGYWLLSVTDTAAGDTGYLKAWCIVFTFGVTNGGIQTVEIPNTYRLYQNYPNPFNPVTKIRYGVPKNGYVKLTIYDELGKEVDVVVEGHLEANTYEAVFDATNLPSGVYYYKLEAEGFADSKKMVIIK